MRRQVHRQRSARFQLDKAPRRDLNPVARKTNRDEEVSERVPNCTDLPLCILHADEGGENSAERYMEFSKNRLGQVGQKMYFSFENGVHFDEQRYTRDLLNEQLILEEREKLKTEEDAFDKLFGSLPSEAETAEAVEAVSE